MSQGFRYRTEVLLSAEQLEAIERVHTALGTPRSVLLREGLQMVLDAKLRQIEALRLGTEILAVRGTH